MKVLHLTYRYGTDIYGGAELLFRHISEELVKRGVDVDICTTKTKTLQQLYHSSVLFDNELTNQNINGVKVFRFDTKNPNRLIAYFFERCYHRQLNREEILQTPHIINLIKRKTTKYGGFLLTGWNNIERYKGSVMRWTKKEAALLIHDDPVNRISCIINNPAGLSLRFVCISETDSISLNIKPFFGQKRISIDCSSLSGKIIFKLICNHTMRFIRDHRVLGVSVSDISYYSKQREIKVDMEMDYRHYLKINGDYQKYLLHAAQSRPYIYSWMFDYMRGPNSRKMRKWLKQNIHHYDVVLAQMFPFNTMKYSLEAKNQKKPLIHMPLMHIDDEFYHWSHYYSILKKSDLVLAYSNFSKRELFDEIGVKSIHVGAGVDRSVFFSPDISGENFRKRYDFGTNPIVLTVSRKNQGKKYDIIIRAMERVRNLIPNAIMVMIGPDDDDTPITSEYIHYLGKVDDSILADAYDACSVFTMMSDSESFGMVFCEAWARKKAVIGNKNCGAVSSLIENEIDGLLCSNEEELSDALIRLLSDSNISNTMGKRGYEKVMKSYTWEIVTEKIYSIYKEEMQQNGKSCTI